MAVLVLQKSSNSYERSHTPPHRTIIKDYPSMSGVIQEKQPLIIEAVYFKQEKQSELGIGSKTVKRKCETFIQKVSDRLNWNYDEE